MGNVDTISIPELTIIEFHNALREKRTTCAEVVEAYLARISQYNDTLKALITVNKNALDVALQRDQETETLLQRSEDNVFPPLHGVPIILKDTYSTVDMPTTSGIKALHSLQTNDDAFVVGELRRAGAIILGKANLHEFSLEGITVSSLGGQTRNPYDLTRTPGGSSGGTAAALAANLGLVGCGGDTMNSLRSPASACSIVGFRPTRGQVSRSGIVPVTETQDAVGPMARTVRDARVLFDVMKGEDTGDQATVDELRHRRGQGGNGEGAIRVGVLRAFFADEDNVEGAMVNQTVLDALDKVKVDKRIEIAPLSLQDATWDIPSLIATADMQSYEFRSVFDAFLRSPLIACTPHRTLESIVASGAYHQEAVTPVLHRTLQTAGPYTMDGAEYRSRLETIGALKESVEACFVEHRLDALVYPHQKQLVVPIGAMAQPQRNGILASLTGRPAICLPAGFSPPTQSAPVGVPIGLELMGQPWRDDDLLDLAEHFETIIQGRKPSPLA
ncbi:amidase [Aspergillus clavatus NRRL 1]|uniref:Amidase n=1 Tax=Aspergillus clavatus (strain ATCC 1007 / CBS 513.65 / DSM 816 / NCTC 3887 / NRRL 1 / QM 1276 / 107) TaxID=344612 RepID=A1CNE6_ASPCL|nr:amidase [Aspergillus clavatus NRRL 1]EAW07167.1 amidase [Aspergillus clavatus NRRL 1]